MLNFKMSTVIAAAGLVIASAVNAAAWEGHWRARRAIAWSCYPDVARLCPDVPAGGHRILRCLSDQRDLLSEPCYRSLRILAAIEACRLDFDHHCRGVVPGAGRGLACMQGNKDRLSPPCHRALSGLGPPIVRSDDYEQALPPRGPAGGLPRQWGYEPPDLSEAPLK